MVSNPTLLTSTPRASPANVSEDGPRTDFDVLAQRLGGRIVYPDRAAPAPVAALERRLRVSLSQAVRARRLRSSAYVSFSERVGMPLSLLRPAAPHVQIAHLLTSPQKRRAAELTRYLKQVDLTLVFSRPQERYLREHAGLGPDRARFIFDKVDHRFFTPPAEPRRAGDGYVLSVGREQRDYGTLVEAVSLAGLATVIVAGSTWSHRKLVRPATPDHVELRAGLSYAALLDLYRNARVVVVPVRAGTDYAAGVNAVLEGMACGKPVIASSTPGLAGYVRDGVDGRSVAAGDPAALRDVIEELWEDDAGSRALGAAARQWVEAGRTVEHFVERVAGAVESML